MSSSLSPERSKELDAVFTLLADARRRVLIETVYDAGSIDMGELAVTIARRERGHPITVNDQLSKKPPSISTIAIFPNYAATTWLM